MVDPTGPAALLQSITKQTGAALLLIRRCSRVLAAEAEAQAEMPMWIALLAPGNCSPRRRCQRWSCLPGCSGTPSGGLVLQPEIVILPVRGGSGRLEPAGR